MKKLLNCFENDFSQYKLSQSQTDDDDFLIPAVI